jgi:hypothetical protein
VVDFAEYDRVAFEEEINKSALEEKVSGVKKRGEEAGLTHA